MVVDTLSSLIFNNQLSQATFSTIEKTAKVLLNASSLLIPKTPSAPQIIQMVPDPLWKLAGKNNYFIRIAGVSGAAAVILGAYGAHRIAPDKEIDDQMKVAFETANKYHFFHTLALLGVPLSRHPVLSGSLFLLGISLFSGSCYYYALTGDNTPRRLAPVGGVCFILGWLTVML